MTRNNDPADAINIVVIDDDPYIRDGLVQLLNNVVGMQSTGVYASPEQFLSTEHTVPPDLLLLDVSLNGSSGIDAIPVLRNRFPEMTILMHSNYDDSDHIRRSREAGARGYLFKNSSAPALYEAIQQVAGGSTVWPPGYQNGESIPSGSGAYAWFRKWFRFWLNRH